MKLLKNTGIVLLCIIGSITASGQQNTGIKPNLFNAFPSVINCTEQELTRVFGMAEGQSITLLFSNNFSFAGPITRNVEEYSYLRTAFVKSPAFNNALFSVSKITNTDGSTAYSGIIMHEDYADGYQLKKQADGSYTLTKFVTARVRTECKQ